MAATNVDPIKDKQLEIEKAQKELKRLEEAKRKEEKKAQDDLIKSVKKVFAPLEVSVEANKYRFEVTVLGQSILRHVDGSLTYNGIDRKVAHNLIEIYEAVHGEPKKSSTPPCDDTSKPWSPDPYPWWSPCPSPCPLDTTGVPIQWRGGTWSDSSSSTLAGNGTVTLTASASPTHNY